MTSSRLALARTFDRRRSTHERCQPPSDATYASGLEAGIDFFIAGLPCSAQFSTELLADDKLEPGPCLVDSTDLDVNETQGKRNFPHDILGDLRRELCRSLRP